MHPVDKMKRRKLPSIKESENIPIDLEPSLFGGFNYSNGNPADFTLKGQPLPRLGSQPRQLLRQGREPLG